MVLVAESRCNRFYALLDLPLPLGKSLPPALVSAYPVGISLLSAV